eukprot:TRINITY_DN62467_c0_g1_i1.p1 TRINITY_DN62467_c0_g1~~TRINITY_DN62467_c0_g1_i1.p1  ORF type:complete len:581 (-),score=56.57 TRINITY_DN62467_c0_g1_i1:101-1843(-)
MNDALRLKEEGASEFKARRWESAAVLFAQSISAILTLESLQGSENIDFKDSPPVGFKFGALNSEVVSVLRALFSNRSAANLHMEDSASAVNDSLWCIKVDPCWPKAYFRRAVCQVSQGQMEPAAASMATYFKVNGDIEDHAVLHVLRECQFWTREVAHREALVSMSHVQNKEAIIVVDPHNAGHFSDVQQAWSAVATLGSATIVLRPGSYNLGKTSLELVSDSRLQVIGDIPTGSHGTGVTLKSESHVLVLRAGAKVSCHNINVTSLSDCVQVWPGASASMEDCTITSQMEIGVACEGHATLSQCVIHNSSTGLLAANGGKVIAHEVIINDCLKAAAEVRQAGSNLSITESAVQDCAASGVVLHGDAKGLRVTGTTFRNCGHLRKMSAISVVTGKASISSCTFASNCEAVMVCHSGLLEMHKCTIEDGSLGVTFREGGSGSIISTTISRMSLHAVFLYYAPGRVSLRENNIAGHVYVEGDTSYPLTVEDGTPVIRAQHSIDSHPSIAKAVHETERQHLKQIRKASRSIGQRGVCEGCGELESPGVKFQLCLGCKQTLYCSRVCQKRKWKTHKVVCRLHQQ